MKITFIAPDFLCAGGGAPLYSRRLAEELAKRGHEVTVLADRPEESANGVIKTPDGCRLSFYEPDLWKQRMAKRVLALARRRGFYRIIQWLKANTRLGLYAVGPVCGRLAQHEALQGRDVICLIHSGGTPLLWNIQSLLARKHRTFLAMSVPVLHPRDEVISWPAYRRMHRQFDVVNTFTEFEEHFLSEVVGLKNRIAVTGVGGDSNGEDADGAAFRLRYNIPLNAPLVLFLGRKVFHKGITHVVEAMDRVWAVRSDACLVLMGFPHNPPSWLEGYLAKTRRGLSGRVVNIDNASVSEREEALAACTLMAAPSVGDSFGIVYLDAWRHKKPVVGCRETCCESFIRHGENGWLVEFGDIDETADAILAAVNDRDLASKMGENGYRMWKENYTWEIIAEKTEHLMQFARNEMHRVETKTMCEDAP